MQLKGLPARHTRPCTSPQQLKSVQRATLRSNPAGRRARCIAESTKEQGAQQKAASQPKHVDSFPQMEDQRLDDGWLPKRQPGSFPSPEVRPRFGGLSSAWERFTVSARD